MATPPTWAPGVSPHNSGPPASGSQCGVPGAWDSRAALNLGQKPMCAGREGAGWWQLSITHLELILRFPSDSARPASLRRHPPGDRDGMSVPVGSLQRAHPRHGSQIPLPAPRAGLSATGSAGFLGAGRGRPSLEPRFNPNSPGTNFSPLSHLFFFFFPSSINGWKCFRFWQRALDVAVSDGSRGLRPGNLWG